MRPSSNEIDALARMHGFPPDTVEVVAKLLELLIGIRDDAFTRGRLTLKGGTAINLFVLDVPRLSVDIDLNYVGTATTEELDREKILIDEALRRILRAAGAPRINDGRRAHALTRLDASFRGLRNQRLTVKVEVNWLLRVPLWGIMRLDSRVLPSAGAVGISVVDLHELIGGKTVALLDRCVPRDFFDFAALMRDPGLDPDCLRTAVVALSACTKSLDLRRRDAQLRLPPRAKMRDAFVPVLGARGPRTEAGWQEWEARLLADCGEGIAQVLPLRDRDREFLDRLLDHGDLRADLLTADAALADRLERHPGIQWRAQNAKKHNCR